MNKFDYLVHHSVCNVPSQKVGELIIGLLANRVQPWYVCEVQEGFDGELIVVNPHGWTNYKEQQRYRVYAQGVLDGIELHNKGLL